MSSASSELFAAPRITLERRGDAMYLRSTEPLGAYPTALGKYLRRGALTHPDRILAAERAGDNWRSLAWGEAASTAARIGTSLLERGLGPERPVMILSGNSLAHLQLTLASYLAGVPVMPISAGYAFSESGRERLAAIAALTTPGLVFAQNGDRYADALAHLGDQIEHHVVADAAGARQVELERLTADAPGAALERAEAEIGPDTVAKVLFTSGSTGRPKGVINTHRMLCSNQQALAQVWPFLFHEPPVLVDWLPWSHTFGGNHNLNQVLAFGGTLYIDDGKPAPGVFDRTVEALREVAPTVYYNVPAGWALLAGQLEADPGLARRFFSRLRFMFTAAAALPGDVWACLRRLAEQHADRPVPLTASWGTTETAPGATTAHFPDAVPGSIGVPLPGVVLKLVPAGDKREIRIKGPNITPGYLHRPDLTAAAFDEEGFYRTGDAVTFVDSARPDRGLLFDGRLAEDFKLTTGTFVHVGKLRLELLSAAGVLTDAVICGQDRDYVAALAWLSAAGTERIAGRADAPLDHPRIVAHLAHALANLNRGAGSSGRIERLLLLDSPPSPAAGEITDKGYINQRAVINARHELVQRLFTDQPAPGVIVPSAVVASA